MRDLVAAHFANAPAPQAPARNPTPPSPDLLQHRQPSTSSLETFNSHRKIRRPKLGDRKVYRPVRRHTLSRIDETPTQTFERQRSKSLQHSTDFSSTRPILRSRSNISADTSRSVPVCNQSQDIENQLSSSPQYAEPKGYDSTSSYSRQEEFMMESNGRPVSMTDLPIMVPLDPTTGAYVPYPEYAYYHDENCRRWKYNKKRKASKNNLYLAFMY
ncbi:hypothetical protein O0L34_g5057 [Tuta absoluta]|nr:hypothetical protein O0L34_g5057 [Tuta absoluta]